jgi:uncharacterized protein YjbJ (UPF0337 family)
MKPNPGLARSLDIWNKPTESPMNWDIVKGKWKQMTGSAKSNWGELTDDDLQQVDGERERLVGKIQEKYGIARDKAEEQVDDWANRT